MHILSLVLTTTLLESAEKGEWLKKWFHDQSPRKVWNQAEIELTTPGSAVGFATDWAMGPVSCCYVVAGALWCLELVCVVWCWHFLVILTCFLTFKAPITTAADNKFCDNFPNFRKNKVWYYMRIVCQQTILMKYHALFVIFEKSKIWNCRLLQIIGGALRVNVFFPASMQTWGLLLACQWNAISMAFTGRPIVARFIKNADCVGKYTSGIITAGEFTHLSTADSILYPTLPF